MCIAVGRGRLTFPSQILHIRRTLHFNRNASCLPRLSPETLQGLDRTELLKEVRVIYDWMIATRDVLRVV